MLNLFDYIVLTVGLYFVMIVVQAGVGSKSHSFKTLVGARDNMADQGVLIARCRRANANMVEGMLMFFPLAFVAVMQNPTGQLALTGAAIFFFSRVVFAVTYWMGVPWVRTIAWFASILGLILMFIQVLPF